MDNLPSSAEHRRAAERDQDLNNGQAPRRRSRRRLIKAAVAAGAGVAGASGYIKPSVRMLQIPTAHAFSF